MLRVVLCYGECAGAGIGGVNGCVYAVVLAMVQAVVRQRTGNGAAACAHVGKHRVCGQGGEQIQSPLHQGFGIGARVEHVRVYCQRQAKKLALAKQVGYGLARQPPLQQLLPVLLLGWGEGFGVVCEQPCAVLAALP